MMTTNAIPPPPRRRWRRFRLIAGSLLLVLVAGILALPYGLGTPAARRWLLEQANRTLAPNGRLEVASFRFSWFGPTRMTGFTIEGADGRVLVTAPVALWDRPLGRILFDRPRLGHLVLQGYRLDVQRRADGTVDLLEALAPILTPDPQADWTISLVHGSIRVRSPGLASPLTAARGEVVIRRPPAPQPLSWRVRLADGTDGAARELQVVGSFNRWNATRYRPGDLGVTITGRRWPLDLAVAAWTLRAPFTGAIEAQRRAGRWTTTGRIEPSELDATFPAGVDGPIHLSGLAAGWDVLQGDEGWEVRSLDVSSRYGTLQARGNADESGVTTHAEASLRVDEILRSLRPDRRPTELLAGLQLDGATARVVMDVERPAADGAIVVPVSHNAAAAAAPLGGSIRLAGSLRLEGVRRDGDGNSGAIDPITLDLDAQYTDATAGTIEFGTLDVRSELANVRASGRLSDLGTIPRIGLHGTLEPDPATYGKVLADALGTEVSMTLGPLAFQVAGTLLDANTLARSIDAELRVPIRSADLYGLELGPTELVGRAVEGHVSIEPIRTTLNGGRMALWPEIVTDDDWTRVTLRFAPGSVVEQARINDEVSRRVLAFVVPTLAEATRARGLVSVDVTRAEIPLLGEGHAVVEGNVVFEDVEFAPGPLADQLLGLAFDGPSKPTLRLDQPVVLAIHDGKVHQHGMSIPLGNVARVEMEGTVDFDKNLDLAVSIPLAAERFVNRPVLSFIAGGVRPTIPIRGTLDEPRVDTRALKQEMGQMGLDVAERAGIGFAGALVQKMMTPRTPEEQARIDEEKARRKAVQQRKKLERRMRRGR
jgi:hypothetical protein